ncbi:hypothetical protein [Melissospora conviva]|uniref:hypothetical protein n=1 Tax=Melissospora conviva TaxID=3388432 RepID=UPI003C1B1C7C
MGGVGPGSAREEAERLVATVLGAVRLAATEARSGGSLGPLGEAFSSVLNHTPNPAAADSDGPPPVATGSPECCVCPVCRAITAVRDPNPEFAERLATGAGDLAAGVASLLRAFSGGPGRDTGEPDSTASGRDAEPAPGPGPDAESGARSGAATEPAPDVTGLTPGDVWRQATRSGHDCPSSPESHGRTEAVEGNFPGTEPVTDHAVSPASAVDGEPPSAVGGTQPAVPASREPSEAPVVRSADDD